MERKIVIDIEKGYFIKYPTQNSGKAEVSATVNANDLGNISKLFYVPKILDYAPDYSWIKFEYLPNLTPLSQLLSERNEKFAREKFFELGKALSFVHNNLSTDCEKYSLPEKNDWHGRKTFIHGDFNLTNNQFDRSRNCLVILDWSSSPLSQSISNWGTYYYDIISLLNSIFNSYPYFSFDYSYRKMLADNFLSGYISQSGDQFDKNDFVKYGFGIHKEFLKGFRRRSDIAHYLVYLPNRLNLKRYLKSYEK